MCLLEGGQKTSMQYKTLQLYIEVEHCKMTSPQGLDELFCGQDHEDVNDWVKRVTMVDEVQNLNAYKLFKITKLNLRGRIFHVAM